jgi:hypothetical protein
MTDVAFVLVLVSCFVVYKSVRSLLSEPLCGDDDK